jgi:hypothetical protein
VVDTTLTPSRVWKSMTPEQRQRAARAFWMDEEAEADQVQAAMLIAQQRNFRPKTVVALDVDKKARHLATIAQLPDSLAARALIVYHLAEQRAMMAAFLDALGIAHEDGLIKEDEVRPDASKFSAAAEKIRGQFPSEDVQLYLNTLLCQDPEAWGGLKGVLSTAT